MGTDITDVKNRGRWAALREVMRPWYIKVATGASIFATVYSFGCDQFGWPKLPALWNMTGANIPWWIWLFAVQLSLIWGLFEYVRTKFALDVPHPVTDTEHLNDVTMDLGALSKDINSVRLSFEKDRADIGLLKEELRKVPQGVTDSAVKDLSNQLTALNKLVQPIWIDHQQAKVNATIAELERMKFPLPEVGSDSWQARPIWTGPSLEQTMKELGITDAQRNASNAELKSEIKADAIYMTLQDGDEAHWANGNDKRQWHLLNAHFEADIRLLRNRMMT